jgi:hypothetical protein
MQKVQKKKEDQRVAHFQSRKVQKVTHNTAVNLKIFISSGNQGSFIFLSLRNVYN